METVALTAPPSLPRLYARALRPGRPTGEELPAVAMRLDDVTVDRDHAARYARVCGFAVTDALPATYLHVLAFPLAVALMSRRDFPLPLPGLVHLANRITQHRPVTAAEPLAFHVHAADLRPTHRGREVDLHATAEVAGEVVWAATSTYLHRSGARHDPGTAADRRPGPDPDDPPLPRTATWTVDARVGRRYAAVSGDVNPIHLHPLTARLFGFDTAIAHGMWTAARTLAAFQGRLPTAFTHDVAFAKPLRLPSRVAFAAARADGGWRFAVTHLRTGAPHLRGTLQPASP